LKRRPEGIFRQGSTTLEVILLDAEADRFLELGHIFYEQGPDRVIARLGRSSQEATARGELVKGPPALVSAQFIDLVRGDLQTRAMLGVEKNPTPRVRRAVIKSGVNAFLRAYAPR